MDERSNAGEATQSAAQSRLPTQSDSAFDLIPGQGLVFEIGPRLRAIHRTRSYRRSKSDPLYRKLKIFAFDPAVSKFHGAVTTVEIPYEPLKPGPLGAVVIVENADENGTTYRVADLDDPAVSLSAGYQPSISRPEFHQQMVYAVAMMTYHTFRLALGRDISWAIDNASEGDGTRLTLRPFGRENANAWYDRMRGEIVFGYFEPEFDTPVAPAGRGLVYTSMSHDIIVHEMSHALLDGLRAHFLHPTHPDVTAFHEAFADLIALFQHFTHGDAVRSAIAAHRGDISDAKLLVSLAGEFGTGIGNERGALRTFGDMANEADADPLIYGDDITSPHERGKVLARAVFDAFVEIYRRRTRRFIKLATAERAVLPEGDLTATLEDFLVEEVQKVAGQFATICIRAIDYCPPVDIRFGDFLRAMITADLDLVPDDPYGYRESLIRSFGRRRIYGEGTWQMTEEALAWNEPRIPLRLECGQQIGQIALSGGFAEPANAQTLASLAAEIGRLISAPGTAGEFGIVSTNDPRFGNGYERPVIESIRIARRAGPDKQITFDLVAEVTQQCLLRSNDGTNHVFIGGATVIIDSCGDVRFTILKRVDHEARQQQQHDWIHSAWGDQYWQREGNAYRPPADLSRRLCIQQ